MKNLSALLNFWRADDATAPNIAAWRSLPPQAADALPFPPDLPTALANLLSVSGIDRLYRHQLEAWTHARAGEHILLATSPASGKTLAYNLPVLAALLADPQSRALYLFPTKALAQDQITVLNRLLAALEAPRSAAIYDGDTPPAQRSAVRRNACAILTNPDMLHAGILPHHANWSEFFAGLKFVVIDEAHVYRGVFGSHVANVLRRLRRVAAFYGARPQFILASATIGNPKQHAENLVEEPVRLIDRDGSGRGERHFIIYNPPVVDSALGLRKSAFQESVRLARDLFDHEVQTVVFARSRRSVEILLAHLQALIPHSAGRLRGYRSGYLARERREVERNLRDGSARIVVATNALELGMDIGGLGAALIVGYPGAIAATRQQAGRAGRGRQAAATILVVSANPLDQFLARRPEYLFERSPEFALVNPDHLLILLAHLRCAMFELPFRRGDSFGALPPVALQEFLDFLLANQEAHFSNQTYYWMKDKYPAAEVSLRSASAQSVELQAVSSDGRPFAVGAVDGESAAWMVHPGAVYMHEARQYFVQELNLEQRVARLIPAELDYYTEALRQSEIKALSVAAQSPVRGGRKFHGEMQVVAQVVGFRKLRWFTGETLGQEPLDLPPSVLQTTGYWLALSEETLARLREAGAWSADPNDYGKDWNRIREQVRRRDSYRCQVCGAEEIGRRHDVHHKIPFRAFASAAEANRMENLVTLCKTCHRRAEQNIRIRSGLAGLAFALANLAPLFLMCDYGDLGVFSDPAWSESDGLPAVALYDLVPAGIGFSQRLFELHEELIARAFDLVSECLCENGCPSCVGPGGENGMGGKKETLAILNELREAAPYQNRKPNSDGSAYNKSGSF